MDPELQIIPSDSDDDLFGINSSSPSKSSQQSSRSQSSHRLRSAVQIPQPREHSRTSSLSEISPTPTRPDAHSPPHTRTSIRDRDRSHRHGSRRNRSTRQQRQDPPTRSPRQRTHGKSPGLESNTKQRTAALRSPRDLVPRQQHLNPSTGSPRQSTHGKSPRPESNIKHWTVARLQRALKDRSINFSRYDNKSQLFQLYTASVNTPLKIKEDGRFYIKEAEWYAITSTISDAHSRTADSYTSAPSVAVPTPGIPAPITQLLYLNDY
ncbi:hypothetical protein G5714_010603 [Onychostoma macrolepis]|uniref:Uncharacterized protein n=1 Tax=Onychostoma macrolepis TaxID=369639 RepID=A0A7J6CL95_9TELE|nr:hypothetical protein G5714_010603 [Onychostoma macrolepis]